MFAEIPSFYTGFMCHQVQVFHIENVRTSPDFISYEAHLRMGNLFDTLPL